MRILLAEDDAALAGFVRKGLEAESYAVDVSADGEPARALANELDYDFVILDLQLAASGRSLHFKRRAHQKAKPSDFDPDCARAR